MLNRYLSDIGKLDRRIILRNQTSTKNRFGHDAIISNSDTVVNAAYSYNKATKDETDISSKTTAIVSDYYIIRHLPSVNLTTKIVAEDIEYDIVNIEPIGRRRFLKLEVKRIV